MSILSQRESGRSGIVLGRMPDIDFDEAFDPGHAFAEIGDVSVEFA